MNTFGSRFRLTTFGESHGPAVGGILDGCPAGFRPDRDAIRKALRRRAAQKGGITTERSETDEPEFLSGLTSDGLTNGAPIAFLIRNKGARSADYEELKGVFRPSHADYAYWRKYGTPPQPGGGRASARETAARVVAGAIAGQLLLEKGIDIVSYTAAVGDSELLPYLDRVTLEEIERGLTGCPNPGQDEAFYQKLAEARAEGDTLGGVAATIVRGLPAGVGEPLFDKLHARLSYALLSINAARAFEIGDGLDLSRSKGSEGNDPIGIGPGGAIQTLTNRSGGIQAGISNGEILRFRTYFKPISSIHLPQETADLSGHPRTILIRGRHDASVFPRVLPVCDAMTALTLIDLLL